MTDKIKEILAKSQEKIQGMRADSGNSGIFQEYLYQAGELIRTSSKTDWERLKELRDELYFYTDGGEDNLGKFYKCKAESLTIIAKYVI